MLYPFLSLLTTSCSSCWERSGGRSSLTLNFVKQLEKIRAVLQAKRFETLMPVTGPCQVRTRDRRMNVCERFKQPIVFFPHLMPHCGAPPPKQCGTHTSWYRRARPSD
ncbi:hypothetical protein CHARACLAT_025588 [Characodon lateralis]|uniref:Secreted protein n=1 Tax=Characodon lateralis TaxID=208331 RepID=A0ABU7DVF4_9TELE|nr:hypothetical protein [Characodon lateralis]